MNHPLKDFDLNDLGGAQVVGFFFSPKAPQAILLCSQSWEPWLQGQFDSVFPCY